MLFAISFVVPLVGALVALMLPSDARGNAVFQCLMIAGSLSGIFAVGLWCVASLSGVPVQLFIASSLFGETFQVGFLSTFFLGIIYVGALLASVYAIPYLAHYERLYTIRWLNVASALFIFGMQATVVSATLFVFLLFWEVMSIAAYFLVIADRKSESLSAGFLYFVMTHIGILCIGTGFFILSGGDPLASFSVVATRALALDPLAAGIAFVLILVGFGSKAGLVPLHQWLPYAHPQAPSHSSALLSGVMLKVALFGFLQALFLFPYIPLWAAVLVVVVGLLSAVFGVVHAAVESDIKRLLAWSSIENMGLIFSAIGAISALQHFNLFDATPALVGLVVFVVLHTLNHFIFKTGLFLSAGAIQFGAHTRDLDYLGGLAQKWPTFSVFALALIFAASALPPLGTFFAEWSFLQSLALLVAAAPPVVALSALIVLSVVALVAGLAVFTFVKVFAVAFLGRARTKETEDAQPLPRLLVLPIGVCAALSVLMAFVAAPLASLIANTETRGLFSSLNVLPDASLNATSMWFVIVCVACIVLFLRSIGTDTRPARITDTWDCGQPLTPRMQYTATGFAAPIRFFFRALVMAEKNMIRVPVVESNSWITKNTLTWGTASLWEVWAYQPLGRGVLVASRMIARVERWSIHFYILCVFIALIVGILIAL